MAASARWVPVALSCVLLLGMIGLGQQAIPHDPQYDVAILDGRVIDPESGFDAVRNLGIRDGKVVAITTQRIVGRQTIVASRLVVAPGFIDLHEHGQEPINYQFQARDGVTTSLDWSTGPMMSISGTASARAKR